MTLKTNKRLTGKRKTVKYYIYDLDSQMCLCHINNCGYYWNFDVKKAKLFDTKELAETQMKNQKLHEKKATQ